MLDPQFREFEGRTEWKTEKMAKRDAAFEAYAKLYYAGLVNDNLLPAHVSDYENVLEVDKRPGLVQVPSPSSPWAGIAAAWQTTNRFYQSIVEITSSKAQAPVFPQMVMVLPFPLPCDISFPLYWNEDTTLTASLSCSTAKFDPNLLKLAGTTTHILLSSIFASRMVAECMDFSCLFLPKLNKMSVASIKKWCESVKGTMSAAELTSYDADTLEELGMVRCLSKYLQYKRPLVAEKCVYTKRVVEDSANDDNNTDEDIDAEEELHFEGPAWPKRTDFLHPVQNTEVAKKMHTSRRCHPVSESHVDKLPTKYARFAQFIPSILHNIGNHLIAQELKQTILTSIAFNGLDLILTAISASAARERTNYQRLEFYGDCQLKLHTSLQLAATNPMWHEDLLSRHKDAIVSNTRLSRAAVETGLHRFILLKVFTGARWRPFYNSDHLGAGEPESTRDISTKVLADVVESLIGAATVDGGHEKTLKCLQIFLPDVKWDTYESRIQKLYDDAEPDIPNTPMSTLKQIEGIVGYEFTKKSLLLAAFTHPSCPTPGLTYQRLEFIGDSVLDSIVVRALFESPKKFPHYQMHLMRSALVNADFLAFLAMNTSTDVLRGEISSVSPARNGRNNTATVTTETTVHHVALWQHMRHSHSRDFLQPQRRASKRFERYRVDIANALDTSRTYPWTLLSHVGAGKFFSDLIESVLGAILIDSRGSMDACHAFLERVGLMKYLRRVLHEDIDVMHPKERLGVIAGKRNLKVLYLPERVRPEDDGEEVNGDRDGDARRWKCLVRVGGEDVAQADGAISRLEAESKAAEAAIATMQMAHVHIADEPVGLPEDDGEENGEVVPEPDGEDGETECGIYVLV